MLKQDITEIRKNRHKKTQEDFTPECIVELMYKEFSNELYTDFSKTILDPCAGIGNLLIYCIKRRLEYCKNESDIYLAINTIFGTELLEDNVLELHNKILNIISIYAYNNNIIINSNKINNILKHNIVCTDTFKWDYEQWSPVETKYCNKLF